MKQFTSIKDVKNLSALVKQALEIKSNPLAFKKNGENKTICLLFFNPSLRTRLSTQKAAYNLGMNVMVMNVNSDGWQIEFEDGTIMDKGTQEHIKEAAGVVSQYCDIIGLRTFPSLVDKEADYKESILNKFIQYASAPILSLESATLHPLQSFADLITIEENKKIKRPKVVLSWAPHPKVLPQCVANSFSQWMGKAEVDFVITNPKGFNLSKEFTKGIEVIHDQEVAFKNADFIYAKNWSAYDNYGGISQGLDSWKIDKKKMDLTNKAKFMHCLPIRRNVEATDAVIDSENSLVLEQANNRTFAAQTIIYNLLQNEG